MKDQLKITISTQNNLATVDNPISEQVFSKVIQSTIEGTEEIVSFDQVRTISDPEAYKTYSKAVTFSIQNHLSKKRVLLNNSYQTKPYGYC